jgi:predicted O-methyltransferase YrrM
MSRAFKHWTLHYLIDRTRERAYRLTHPGLPWLAPLAIQLLEAYLKPTDAGLEFGSGRSTLWFARRVASLTSVEHNPVWYRTISDALKTGGIRNVCYQLIEGGSNPAYAQAAEGFADNSLDFVLVDGIQRDDCANAVRSKIRPGGLLILDDAHRYLPSDSIAPYARRPDQGAASPAWQQFLEAAAAWRCLWTGNGVSDTAIFIKWRPD